MRKEQIDLDQIEATARPVVNKAAMDPAYYQTLKDYKTLAEALGMSPIAGLAIDVSCFVDSRQTKCPPPIRETGFMERETRLELATTCLEGRHSTN